MSDIPEVGTKLSALSHFAFGTAKREDLASQPRDSLNVVVYEISGDRKTVGH
jgi:hypothetical protein